MTGSQFLSLSPNEMRAEIARRQQKARVARIRAVRKAASARGRQRIQHVQNVTLEERRKAEILVRTEVQRRVMEDISNVESQLHDAVGCIGLAHDHASISAANLQRKAAQERLSIEADAYNASVRSSRELRQIRKHREQQQNQHDLPNRLRKQAFAEEKIRTQELKLMARRQGEVAEIRREHARAIKVRQDTVSHQRGELAKTIMQDVQRSKEMERTLRKAATADRQQKLEEARLRAQEDDGHALKRIEKSMSEQRLLNRTFEKAVPELKELQKAAEASLSRLEVAENLQNPHHRRRRRRHHDIIGNQFKKGSFATHRKNRRAAESGFHVDDTTHRDRIPTPDVAAVPVLPANAKNVSSRPAVHIPAVSTIDDEKDPVVKDEDTAVLSSQFYEQISNMVSEARETVEKDANAVETPFAATNVADEPIDVANEGDSRDQESPDAVNTSQKSDRSLSPQVPSTHEDKTMSSPGLVDENRASLKGNVVDSAHVEESTPAADFTAPQPDARPQFVSADLIQPIEIEAVDGVESELAALRITEEDMAKLEAQAQSLLDMHIPTTPQLLAMQAPPVDIETYQSKFRVPIVPDLNLNSSAEQKKVSPDASLSHAIDETLAFLQRSQRDLIASSEALNLPETSASNEDGDGEHERKAVQFTVGDVESGVSLRQRLEDHGDLVDKLSYTHIDNESSAISRQ